MIVNWCTRLYKYLFVIRKGPKGMCHGCYDQEAFGWRRCTEVKFASYSCFDRKTLIMVRMLLNSAACRIVALTCILRLQIPILEIAMEIALKACPPSCAIKQLASCKDCHPPTWQANGSRCVSSCEYGCELQRSSCLNQPGRGTTAKSLTINYRQAPPNRLIIIRQTHHH